MNVVSRLTRGSSFWLFLFFAQIAFHLRQFKQCVDLGAIVEAPVGLEANVGREISD